ncbi:Na+/H+ antiporter NhaA [Thalassospiraceae bacterium LMO-JJ14]|nr:Na+/H+ antiporter NhaA [Thalassospiraceae bacterium LMO-JJ14]
MSDKQSLNQLLHHEAAPGVLLVIAAALAMAMENSPLAWLYDSLLGLPVVVGVGGLVIDKPLLLWINDGLMAVFFFMVGLEIKREVLTGRLSSFDQASLPALAAIGGMAAPALIYLAITSGDAAAASGWAIPSATDIAFALGVLSLLGNRVPVSLKVFLLAIAIIDDLGAILIIAFFYTEDLSLYALTVSLGAASILVLFNRLGIRALTPYLLVGIVLWVMVLKSGVHATLAGVLIALTLPLRPTANDPRPTRYHDIEHALHPWVAFLVMPVFAFANSGIPLAGFQPGDLLQPVPLGIALGLFVGKQIGVMGFCFAAVRLRLCALPEDATWLHIYGISLLTGIGFTMSLFIGGLAFAEPALAAQVRFGVLGGSCLSAVLGYTVLRLASRRTSVMAAPSSSPA